MTVQRLRGLEALFQWIEDDNGPIRQVRDEVDAFHVSDGGKAQLVYGGRIPWLCGEKDRGC